MNNILRGRLWREQLVVKVWVVEIPDSVGTSLLIFTWFPKGGDRKDILGDDLPVLILLVLYQLTSSIPQFAVWFFLSSLCLSKKSDDTYTSSDCGKFFCSFLSSKPPKRRRNQIQREKCWHSQLFAHYCFFTDGRYNSKGYFPLQASPRPYTANLRSTYQITRSTCRNARAPLVTARCIFANGFVVER
jgi:hypothetical protein